MTVAPEPQRTALVPYIPYPTFKAFFEKVDPIPPTLDRSVLRYTSGSVQRLLLSSLRALDLIDDAGRVVEGNMGPVAKAFKSGDRAQLQKALQERIRATYPSLFDTRGGFNFTTATPAQLKQKFDEIGASGDTIRKAVSFLLAACDEAGIEYSPHFKARGALTTLRRPSATNGSGAKRTPKNKAAAITKQSNVQRNDSTDLPEIPIPVASVIQRLPKDGSTWTADDKKKFLAALEVMLDLCFPISTEKK